MRRIGLPVEHFTQFRYPVPILMVALSHTLSNATFPLYPIMGYDCNQALRFLSRTHTYKSFNTHRYCIFFYACCTHILVRSKRILFFDNILKRHFHFYKSHLNQSCQSFQLLIEFEIRFSLKARGWYICTRHPPSLKSGGGGGLYPHPPGFTPMPPSPSEYVTYSG